MTHEGNRPREKAPRRPADQNARELQYVAQSARHILHGELHRSALRSRRLALLARAPFANRRFTRRTIEALVADSIDAPERLLFMTEPQLWEIPGVGKTSMAEIKAYRHRFLN